MKKKYAFIIPGLALIVFAVLPSLQRPGADPLYTALLPFHNYVFNPSGYYFLTSDHSGSALLVKGLLIVSGSLLFYYVSRFFIHLIHQVFKKDLSALEPFIIAGCMILGISKFFFLPDIKTVINRENRALVISKFPLTSKPDKKRILFDSLVRFRYYYSEERGPLYRLAGKTRFLYIICETLDDTSIIGKIEEPPVGVYREIRDSAEAIKKGKDAVSALYKLTGVKKTLSDTVDILKIRYRVYCSRCDVGFWHYQNKAIRLNSDSVHTSWSFNFEAPPGKTLIIGAEKAENKWRDTMTISIDVNNEVFQTFSSDGLETSLRVKTRLPE